MGRRLTGAAKNKGHLTGGAIDQGRLTWIRDARPRVTFPAYAGTKLLLLGLFTVLDINPVAYVPEFA